jgi:hypothetical protein
MTLDRPFEELVKSRRSLFISSKSFSLRPPHLRKVEKGALAGHYRVDVNLEGPLLHLTLPACYRFDANGVPVPAADGGPELHLAPGMLSHQREYFNPELQRWDKPSDAVRTGYKEIVGRIKARLVRHRFHVPIWIGKDALREVQEHAATIHGFGLD